MTRRMLHLPITRRRGYSLVELALAIFVMSLIFIGLHSAIVIAARSADDTRKALPATPDALRATEIFAADVACATSVSQAAATSITFTVPDRTGDGAPDTIRYNWTGVQGQPLVRTVNGASSNLTASGLRSLRFDYNTLSKARPQTYTRSSEQLLSSYESATSLADFRVQDKKFIGQYVVPVVPAGASSYTVTRLQIRARLHGATGGQSRIELRNALSSGKPTTIIDEARMMESSLPLLYGWQEFSFTAAHAIASGQGVCLVVQWVKDADACDVQYQSSGATAAGGFTVTTVDDGLTWTSPSGQDLIYRLYGVYVTPDPIVYASIMQSVRMTLGMDDARSPLQHAVVQTLNQPEVTP